MRRYLVPLALLCLLVTITAGCGSAPSTEPLSGTWYLTGSETPAFTLDNHPSCPQATQSGQQLTIPTASGDPQTAAILSQEDGQLTLAFEGAGILTFQDAPGQAAPFDSEGGENAE